MQWSQLWHAYSSFQAGVNFHNCRILFSIVKYSISTHVHFLRDVFGDTTVIGDQRWGGSYGVDADFIAGEQCSVAWIWTHHIQVATWREIFGEGWP